MAEKENIGVRRTRPEEENWNTVFHKKKKFRKEGEYFEVHPGQLKNAPVVYTIDGERTNPIKKGGGDNKDTSHMRKKPWKKTKHKTE